MPYDEARAYARKEEAMIKMVSAKDGRGIKEVFRDIAQAVVKHEKNRHSRNSK